MDRIEDNVLIFFCGSASFGCSYTEEAIVTKYMCHSFYFVSYVKDEEWVKMWIVDEECGQCAEFARGK